MAIPFTQYLRPDGRRHRVTIQLDVVTEDKARKIIERGLTFETEVLANGLVSFTITDEEEGDLAIEISPNGPNVPEAIKKLVADFPL